MKEEGGKVSKRGKRSGSEQIDRIGGMLGKREWGF